jgi:ferredoxin--NADP+ reductase
MQMADYDIQHRHSATVLRTERITAPEAAEEVRELVLEVDGDGLHYEVGQTVGVLIEGPHAFGEKFHHRLYSIADAPEPDAAGHSRITLVVRRCNYVDDYSGERFRGVSSNFLCDRKVGDRVILTGPFGLPFRVPDDRTANLVLVGLGTGIAPFRGLVKHIYQHVGDWQGQVRLLYGARSGLELLYMNDQRNDFARYVDEDTFEAISALSPRPGWDDPIAWDFALEERAEEIWQLLEKGNTYVYVAGLKPIGEVLDRVFARVRSAQEWDDMKRTLVDDGRWVELLY